MTYKQFLKKLGRLKGNGWSIETSDGIRCSKGDCPLVAVYRAEHPYSKLGWGYGYTAARRLDLKANAAYIMDAADHYYSTTKDVRRIRQDIIKVLNLKELPNVR